MLARACPLVCNPGGTRPQNVRRRVWMSLASRVLNAEFTDLALGLGRACKQGLSHILPDRTALKIGAGNTLGRRGYDRCDTTEMRLPAHPAAHDVIVIDGFDPAEDALMAEVETAEDVGVLGQSVLDDGVLISFDNGLRAFLPGLTEPVPESSILIVSRFAQPDADARIAPEYTGLDAEALPVPGFDETEDVLIVDPSGSADVSVTGQTVTDEGLLVRLSSGSVICLEGLCAPIDPALIMTRPPRKRAVA